VQDTIYPGIVEVLGGEALDIGNASLVIEHNALGHPCHAQVWPVMASWSSSCSCSGHTPGAQSAEAHFIRGKAHEAALEGRTWDSIITITITATLFRHHLSPRPVLGQDMPWAPGIDDASTVGGGGKANRLAFFLLAR